MPYFHFQDDAALLGTEKEKPLPLKLKNAVLVRLGEKRILHGLLQAITSRLGGDRGESRKRKVDVVAGQ